MAMNLKDEILGGESPVLEFKRDIPDQALKYLKTVSAFANCSGGRIVFGVDSDLSICGMDEAFAYMHVAEKWGLGIPNVVQEFVGHGLAAPEYTDWGNAVKVTVRRIQKKIDIGPEKSDIGAEKRMPEVGELDIGAGKLDIGDGVDTVKGPVKGPVNGPERLFVIIKQNPGLRKTALAELSGLSARTVKRYVETVLAKRIEFRGAPKTGGYYCKE